MGWMKDRRRRRLMATPLPEEWSAMLERNVPYCTCLPPALRSELDGLIQVFIAEKSFEGAGGLVMTDEIRVTIAAQACILLLGREPRFYPGLQAIVVYPRAYLADQARHRPDGVVDESPQARLGESWQQGVLVLSWDDVLRGARELHDGHNVVFHEFAHQLDYESGGAEGVPLLEGRSMYRSWGRVMEREYESLIAKLERHVPTFLDSYGAMNPAEFFAVITEFFFEKPRGLRERHSELYGELKAFYHQDPAEWICRLDPSSQGQLDE
jgi:Mlc titration factor MtfA (ptsG expression regulator)